MALATVDLVTNPSHPMQLSCVGLRPERSRNVFTKSHGHHPALTADSDISHLYSFDRPALVQTLIGCAGRYG